MIQCHNQLRTHLADFVAAYNFARRLKTLSGLTPYGYIAKIWTSERERFIIDPIDQMPGLNIWPALPLRWVTEYRSSRMECRLVERQPLGGRLTRQRV